MKRLAILFIALALATVSGWGANTNAAGNWKWSLPGQNGNTILSLKQEGEKLSGSYTNQFGKAELYDGSIKDNAITFKVKRNFNDQDFVIKYSGKMEGDKINGKSEFEVNGQTRSLKWEATREPAKANASGNWDSAIILGDGNRIEGTLKLKQEGDKLTGATIRNETETKIEEGKISGDEISFKVTREREGRKVTGKYKGKISGDKIKGTVESDWSGDWQTLDWEGVREKEAR